MEKVYGVYQGNISNLDEIKRLTEVELFLAISSLENTLLSYRKIACNLGGCFDVTEDEYALEYLINRTQKFGVELEKDTNGKVLRSGDYASWYEFHMKCFSQGQIDFRKFLELKSRGYNVGRYLPNDSYLEYKKKLLANEQMNQRIKMPIKNAN